MSDYADGFYHECNSAYYIDKIMYLDAGCGCLMTC